MKRLLSPFEYFLFRTGFYFQLLTRAPAFSNDNDDISINKDAIKGNQGLNNNARFSHLYVQIGWINCASLKQVIGSMQFLHGNNGLYLFAESAFK